MADLPCLQSVKLGSEVFKYVHSVVMEWMGWWVRFTDITIHWTREMGSFRRWREGSKDDGWCTLQLQECLENEEWDWAKGWTDISWLVSFRGEGSNFYAIGSVILESMDLLVVWRRHPSTVIRRIHFGYYSFAMVYSLQFLSIGAFSDTAALESVIREYGGYL